MTTYTTTGSVRGSCGHRHKTLNTAARCLRRDQDGCEAQGGYSDRAIVRTDGVPIVAEELTELGRIIGLDVLDHAR